MWSNLAAIFKSKAHLTLRAYKCNLESLKADEDTDIIKHLDELKIYWERINSSPNKEHHISDFNFKLTIGDSLPLSWDNFTDPYINITTDDPITPYTDQRKLISSQQFMGIIKEEYLCRVCRKAEANGHSNHIVNVASHSHNAANGNPSKAKHCKHCGLSNHVTDECRWLGSPKCRNCSQFGHESAKCRSTKRRHDNNTKEHHQKKSRTENSNLATEDTDDEHIFTF